MYKISEYLKALCGAYRSVRHSRVADYWWDMLTPTERVLAYDLLSVTGTEAWKP